MEACGGAHGWAREIQALGHAVRLIPPVYVKPFVKRQRNDMADAAAISEAAARPAMRFVTVKSAEKQASSMVFKTRDLLVRQRTQTINALRGHLAEHGFIAPQGVFHSGRLAAEIGTRGRRLPSTVTELCTLLLQHIARLDEQIAVLDRRIRDRAREDETARRLMSIPGIGPICATALEALTPPPETFARGCLARLTPRQNSSGGKTRLGRISRMGQRDLRRLLIIGSMAVWTCFGKVESSPMSMRNSKMQQRRFTKEFEEEAVRLVQTSGRTQREIAGDLGIGLSTLVRWMSRSRDRGPADRTTTAEGDVTAELKRLRRENEILRQERDILKKATAFFARAGSR